MSQHPRSMNETIFRVQGMHCASCAQTLEKKLLGVQGVVLARVNFFAEKAAVYFDASLVCKAELFDKVRAAGFKPLIACNFVDETRHERIERFWLMLAVALCPSCP